MTKYSTTHIEPKYVEYFVHGAVNLYCDQSGALGPTEIEKRNAYVQSTLEIVWGYMRGTKTLDGSCSDMQCSVAMEARRLFKPVEENVEGGTCEFCGGPNLDHMGGPCEAQIRRSAPFRK